MTGGMSSSGSTGPTGGSIGSTIGKWGGGIFGMALGGPIGAIAGYNLGKYAGGGIGAGLSSLFGPHGLPALGSGFKGLSLLPAMRSTATISAGGIPYGNVPSTQSAQPTATVGATPGDLGHYITQMGQGVTGYGAQAMSEVRKRNII